MRGSTAPNQITKRLLMLLLLSLVALAGVSCQEGERRPKSGVKPTFIEIDVTDFAFQPSEISVAAPHDKENPKNPTALTFYNKGNNKHSFTVDGVVDITIVELPGKGQNTFNPFNKAGTFDFYCRYHRDQGMVGKVTIGEGTPSP